MSFNALRNLVRTVSGSHDAGTQASPRQVGGELRRALENQTEDLLYRLYDYVAPLLAAHFRALRTTADEQITVLGNLAESLGLTMEEAPGNGRPNVDVLAWQPVARSASLFLFSSLVDTTVGGAPPRRLSAAEWAREADASLDRDLFAAQTALPHSDIPLALGFAARAVTQWERLQGWEFLFFRDTFLVLHTDAHDESVLVSVATDLPVGVLAPSHGGSVVRSGGGREASVPATGLDFIPAFADVQVLRTGDTLAFETPDVPSCQFASLEVEGPFSYKQARGFVRIVASSPSGAKVRLERDLEIVDTNEALLLKRHVMSH